MISELSLTELGAIGELIGSLGVILSLLYLGTQIRHNTRSVRSSSYQSVVEAVNQVNRMLVQERGLPALVLRGQQNLGDLDADDRVRFGAFLAHIVYNHEIALHLYNQGFLDGGSFESHRASVVHMLGAPGASAWWRAARSQMSRALRQHIDRELNTGARSLPK